MTVRKELLNNIRIVDPYVPGEQPRQKVVKLNTNENPYPPAPEVKAVFDELKEDEFRLYPGSDLREAYKSARGSIKSRRRSDFCGSRIRRCAFALLPYVF